MKRTKDFSRNVFGYPAGVQEALPKVESWSRRGIGPPQRSDKKKKKRKKENNNKSGAGSLIRKV